MSISTLQVDLQDRRSTDIMTGLNIRSTPQWADYYLALCVAEKCSRSMLFEKVCTWYAQQVGYRPPPPRFVHEPRGPRLNSYMTGMISGIESIPDMRPID